MGVLYDLFGIGKRDAIPSPSTMIGFTRDGGLLPSGVTAATSLGLSAVWRCVDILCNGVSMLDWREFRGNLELPPSRVVARPQAQRTRREWVSLVVSTLALYDVCYLLKVGPEDSEGVPLALWYIDPTLVQPMTSDYTSLLPADEFWIGQQRVPRDRLVILHRSPQPTLQDTTGGVLELARATFAAAIAAERYASRYWQAGGSPQGSLETDVKLDDPKAMSLQDRWRESRARGPDYWPVLDAGLKAKPWGADPTTASAVEARRELVADIGRYFGVPTAILNAPAGDSETYGTTESQGMHLLNFTLSNYIGAIQDAITDELPRGRHMKMDTAVLTRGSFLSRAQAWQLALANQAWVSIEEVREAEGLPPQELPEQPAPTPVAVGGQDNGG